MSKTFAYMLVLVAMVLLPVAMWLNKSPRWRRPPRHSQPASVPSTRPQSPNPQVINPLGVPRQRLAAASWPICRGDQALSGRTADGLGDKFRPAWRFVADGPVVATPVIRKGWGGGGREPLVYFASQKGTVYALTPHGELAWQFKASSDIQCPPLLVRDCLVIGSDDGTLYCLSAATGFRRWEYKTDGQIVGGSTFSAAPDGRVLILVGSWDMMLHCVDLATGKKVWTYQTDNYVNTTPAIEGNTAVFGSCDGTVHGVDLLTGQGLYRLSEEMFISASGALSHNRYYYGNFSEQQNRFFCLDLAAGNVAWSVDLAREVVSSPAVADDRVVFGCRDSKLHCLDLDGKPRWTFDAPNEIDSSPVIAGDKVVFGCDDGRLYILDLATGEQVWSYALGMRIASSPAVAAGMIFIGCNDGSLNAFESYEAKASE